MGREEINGLWYQYYQFLCTHCCSRPPPTVWDVVWYLIIDDCFVFVSCYTLVKVL